MRRTFANPWLRAYITLSGCLLTATAGIKLWSYAGLSTPSASDPVIPALSARGTGLIAATLELGVVMLLLSKAGDPRKLLGILWLSLVFVSYRAAWAQTPGGSRPCPCLGALPEMAGAGAGHLNTALYAMLAFMMLGSILGLFLCRASTR